MLCLFPELGNCNPKLELLTVFTMQNKGENQNQNCVACLNLGMKNGGIDSLPYSPIPKSYDFKFCPQQNQ